MKKFLLFAICILIVSFGEAQTLHSLIFANKKEQGRETDRTIEYNETVELCTNIANALGYKHDLRAHSDVEFTSKVLENDMTSLNVGDDDIIIFYYDGHGNNWDDDNWPHMAFLDKEYWETTAYEKLKQVGAKAKLIMCFSSCCNMGSHHSSFAKSANATSLDVKRTRKLFTEFDGRLGIKASASIRGQYSYSLTEFGAVYGISLRDVLYDVLSSSSKASLTWKDTFEAVKKETMTNEPRQEPQYIIETIVSQPTSTQTTTTTTSTGKATAIIDRVRADEYMIVDGVEYLSVNVRFNTENMNEDGGILMAYFEHPKGQYLKDANGKYCDQSKNVTAYARFGSHKIHAFYSNKTIFLPVSELHGLSSGDTVYITVYVYDNKSKKIVANNDAVSYQLK